MMRSKLQPFYGKRQRFQGIFIKFGMKNGYRGRVEQTVLLGKVALAKKPEHILTDHLWFNYTKGFKALKLRSGDIIEFNARVCSYQKGYSEDSLENPFHWDYHLKNPRQIEIIGHSTEDYSQYHMYNKTISAKVEKLKKLREERIRQWRESQKESQESQKNPPTSVTRHSESANKKLTDFFKNTPSTK